MKKITEFLDKYMGTILFILIPMWIAFMLMVVSNAANADNLVVKSFSYHTSSSYVRDAVHRDYNQHNPTLGYELELSARSYWVAGVYKDSHHGKTYYTGMMWFPGDFNMVKVGVASLILHSKEYQIDQGSKYPVFPVVVPVIEINAGLVKFNVSYLPKVHSYANNGSHVLGVQIKIPMENIK